METQLSGPFSISLWDGAINIINTGTEKVIRMKKILISLIIVSLFGALASPFLMKVWQEPTNSQNMILIMF